jgi:hypothetical protein
VTPVCSVLREIRVHTGRRAPGISTHPHKMLILWLLGHAGRGSAFYDDGMPHGALQSGRRGCFRLVSSGFGTDSAPRGSESNKMHVHGLGPSLFDGVVGDTAGGRVVVFHRCGRLWVTHVDEGLTEGQTSCSL